MMDYSQIFAVISASLGFISTIGGTWLFVSACLFLHRMKKVGGQSSLHQSLFLIHIIKWLSLCDVVFCVVSGAQFLSVISPSTFDVINTYPDWICAIKGFIYQFFLVGGVSWNFIMCVVLLRIIYFRSDLETIGHGMKYYHICAWM